MQPTDDQAPEAAAPAAEAADATVGSPSMTPPAIAPAMRDARSPWWRDLALVAGGAAVTLALVAAFRPGVLSRGDGAASATGGALDVVREAAATVQALATDAPTGTPALSREGLGSFPVRDVNGATVPIIAPGEPAIVMISSRGCGYCRLALRDLGQYAGGRPVPRLRLLTLEGAEDGVPMLETAGVTGAAPIGPATSQTQVLLTFRYRGTPTFVAVDAEGRIRGTMPGYPGPERLASWFDVMLGASDLPALAN
jgi:hypothetical protein